MKPSPKSATLRARCTQSDKTFVRTLAIQFGIDESDVIRMALRALRRSGLKFAA